MNAIIYTTDDDLHLRISKNDCWDMRIDTQEDPPLPLVDAAAGTAVGHGDAGSWRKHPYPTALPVAEVVLGADGQTDVTGATLDLARAVATIKTAQETAEVRVLAQSNVILIHSKRPVSFLADQDLLRAKKPRPNTIPIETWVSQADEGEQGPYRYLHQNIHEEQWMHLDVRSRWCWGVLYPFGTTTPGSSSSSGTSTACASIWHVLA